MQYGFGAICVLPSHLVLKAQQHLCLVKPKSYLPFSFPLNSREYLGGRMEARWPRHAFWGCRWALCEASRHVAPLWLLEKSSYCYLWLVPSFARQLVLPAAMQILVFVCFFLQKARYKQSWKDFNFKRKKKPIFVLSLIQITSIGLFGSESQRIAFIPGEYPSAQDGNTKFRFEN